MAIISEESSVVAILRAAAAMGPEVAEEVGTTLACVAGSGSRRSAIGKPAAVDERFRDQARMVAENYPAGSVESRFYIAISKNTQGRIDFYLRRQQENTLEES